MNAGTHPPTHPSLERAPAGAGRPWLWVAGAILLSWLLAGLAPLATLVSGGSIRPMDLMSDPAEVTGAPWFVGGVSDLNLFVWAGAAAVHLVGLVGLWKVDRPLAKALGSLGVLTVVLTLDDRFLLHEIVLPHLLGIPEWVTYGTYAVITALLVVWHRHTLRRLPETVLLGIAVVALGGSVGLDLTGWDSTTRRVAEETTKMTGAMAWLAFPCAVLARLLSRPALPHPPG